MSDEADRVVDLYDRHAASWDHDRRRDLVIERAWLDRLLALVRPGGALLDLGCATGEPIARYLMQAGHAVTGIDSSPAMIAICRQRFPASEWHVADMRMLDLRRTFDGIVAWDSFFHLGRGDQRRMFPLFDRHAAPGAMLLFTSGPSDGVAIGDYKGESLHHASLDPQQYRALLTENHFEVERHIAEDPDSGGHTVWLCRKTIP
ncbi:MAG: class I SAM-dependent methyltransferase [Proteobacteria bacterium]|nr:class I SAM-dependent methyltransferase [Pseudomonadota bacterium]